MPAWRLGLLRAVRSFLTPLLPDDYLELINPLWSTRELRGRIERITRETPNAATVLIRPGWAWPGHEPGQYLRIGMAVDGIHHWRAYSLTSEPGRPDGCISITPKLVEAGKVSSHLVRAARPGSIVRLGGVEGVFVLPPALPEKLLFVSAGSGITPIMSMLRSLAARGAMTDVVLLHSARRCEDVIFGSELRELAQRHEGFRLHEQHTADRGRMSPQDLQHLCPDWREREAFLSGPGAMLDAMTVHWEPLYRIRFAYPESWMVSLDGGWGSTSSSPKAIVKAASAAASAARISPADTVRPGRFGRTSAPWSKPMTSPCSCSNGTDTGATIRPGAPDSRRDLSLKRRPSAPSTQRCGVRLHRRSAYARRPRAARARPRPRRRRTDLGTDPGLNRRHSHSSPEHASRSAASRAFGLAVRSARVDDSLPEIAEAVAESRGVGVL